MKILLIGKNGQVGWELNRTLLTLGELAAVDFPQIDLSDMQSLRKYIHQAKPDLIVNAAAYTNVDKAESEPDLANLINGVAPGVMAEEARRLGAALIHYSTDYVYNGTKGTPYVETDAPDPVNAYGASKLMGDRAIEQVGGAYLILRTSWVYSLRQGGFVTKVLEWARQQEVMRIVDDQIGSPTWARVLAEATAQVIAQGMGDPFDYLQEKAGIYHVSGVGEASRYDWARAILDYDPDKDQHVFRKLITAKTKDFPIVAPRPFNSSLSCEKAKSINLLLTTWKHSLELCLHSSLSA